MISKGTIAELQRLEKDYGRLTIDLVLEQARNPKSQLHVNFEWDDAKAAEAHRRDTARRLILACRQVAVLRRPNEKPIAVEGSKVRAWLPDRREGGAFVPRNDVLANARARAARIESMRERLRSWCNEAVDIFELEPLRACILTCLAKDERNRAAK